MRDEDPLPAHVGGLWDASEDQPDTGQRNGPAAPGSRLGQARGARNAHDRPQDTGPAQPWGALVLYVGRLSWGPRPPALLGAQAAPGPPCSQNRLPTALSSPRSGHRPPGFPQPRGRRWAVLNQRRKGRPSTRSQLRKAHPGRRLCSPGSRAMPQRQHHLAPTGYLSSLYPPTHPSSQQTSTAQTRAEQSPCSGERLLGGLAVPRTCVPGSVPSAPWAPGAPH